MMNTSTLDTVFRLFRLALFLVGALALSGSPGLAAEPAAKVDALAGQATVAGADGTIRTLAKDDPIFPGDIVSTGPNSRLRILFSDQGVIFLRPSSRFVIDSYTHTGDAKQDESKFSLVKGGFRSVTGAIGQANHDSVKIETPVATIGIRGTDHEGRYCAGDCLDLTDVGVSAPADGLYTGTTSGQTQVGTQQFGAHEYGYTGPDKSTVHLPEAPPILAADPNLKGALTMKHTENKEKGEPGSENKGDKSPPSDQGGGGQSGQDDKGGQGGSGDNGGKGGGGQGGGQGGQSGQSGQTEQPSQTEGKVFEIPAQPSTTRTVQCR